jgi:purine-binding chemotaxis protein CheW
MCSLVVFSLEEHRYALLLSVVETALRVVEVVPLPKAPEIVLGVINLRGEVVPVFNARKRFRLSERAILLSDHLLVAKTPGRKVALLVDSVNEVVACPEENLIAAKRVHPEIEYLQGVAKLDSQLVLIHDLAKFLSLEEESSLEEALRQNSSEVA